ncbi:MAG: hypothetical protein H8E44_28400 [Planctomycetes bacterium]|nr:hypothetical protein [Planctomycetota bacterium]MBL7039216.1 hypothetical protein [Pirellulaceae bacterium]
MACRRPFGGALACLLLIGTAWGAKPAVLHRGCTKPGYTCGIPAYNYQYRPRSSSETAVSRTGILLRTRTSLAEAVEPGPVSLRRAFSDEQVLRYDPGKAQRYIERRIDETLVDADPRPKSRFSRAEQSLERLPPLPEHNVLVEPKPGVTRRVFSDTFTARLPATEPKERTVVELYQLDRPRLKIDHCEISEVALQLRDDGIWVLSLKADQNRRPAEGEPAEYNPRLHIKRNQFVVRLRCMGAFQNESTETAVAAGKPVLADLHTTQFWVQNGQPRYIRTGYRNAWLKEHFEEIDRVEVEFFYYKQHGSPNPTHAE